MLYGLELVARSTSLDTFEAKIHVLKKLSKILEQMNQIRS